MVLNNQLFNLGLDYVGTKEVPGTEHNQLVVGWLADLARWVKDDETPWCSAFVNHLAKVACVQATGRLDARSWLKVNEAVTEPKRGDIVVFWRGKRNGWKGHVGLYVREDEHFIYVLGGNQRNEVSITPYPKYRLLGYRRPLAA